MEAKARITAAIIGAVSALVVVLIKDFIVDGWRNKRERRRSLVQQRLEKAYVPLNYLVYAFAEADQATAAKLRVEILRILKRYGHLLTTQTLSGLYVFVDEIDQAEFGPDLMKRFFQEYDSLRNTFYKDRSSSPSIKAVKKKKK